MASKAKFEECKKNVTKNDKGMQCGVCKNWWHAACENISDENYIFLNNIQTHWYCKKCNAAASTLHQELILLQVKQEDLSIRLKNVESSMITEKRVEEVIETKITSFETRITEKAKDAAKTDIKDTIKEEIKVQLQEKKDEAPTTSSDFEMKKSIRSALQEMDDNEKRKQNLIFHRIPENQNEEINEKETIKDILKLMDLTLEDKDLKTVKRLGKKENKPRPILASFETPDIVESVFKNIRKLKDKETEVSISRDLPFNTRKYREQLLQEAKSSKGDQVDDFLFRIVGPPGKERVVTKKKDDQKTKEHGKKKDDQKTKDPVDTTAIQAQEAAQAAAEQETEQVTTELEMPDLEQTDSDPET